MSNAGDPGVWCATPPAETAAMLAQLLSSGGAVITAQSPHGLSGYVPTRKSPSIILAIVLFLICIIPAVIYLIAGSKSVDEPFAIALVPDGTGTRIRGDGQGRGQKAVLWAVSQVTGIGPVGQTLYSTGDWDGPTIRAITDALDERGILWDAEGDDIVVSSRHETLVDTVVLSITGESPEQAGETSTGPGAIAATERAYATHRWSPEQFRAVTGALDAAAVSWTASDGALIVPTGAGATVDELVTQLTGSRPAAAPPADDDQTGGWRPDPYKRHELRWFDGHDWTGHVADGGVPTQDPATG